jgi:hypothetical protein
MSAADLERIEATHELKTWPEYFGALVDGSKTFEYRRNDRGFRVGDVLHLREWDSITGHYTGRDMRRRVTYVLPTDLSGDFVVMGLDSPQLSALSEALATRTSERDGARTANDWLHDDVATCREALTACQQERDALKRAALRTMNCDCMICCSCQDELDAATGEKATEDFDWRPTKRTPVVVTYSKALNEQMDALRADLTACRAQGEAMRAKVLAYARAYHATAAVLDSGDSEGWASRMTAAAKAQEDAQIDLIAFADAALSSTPTEPKNSR